MITSFYEAEAERIAHSIEAKAKKREAKQKRLTALALAREKALMNRAELKEEVDTHPERGKKFDDLFIHVLSECEANLTRQPVYDNQMQAFWLRLYLMGRRTFRFMQQMLHGPSLSTLFAWINKRQCPKFNDLLAIENIPKILDYYRSRDELTPDPVLISVDAMKIDEDLCIDHSDVNCPQSPRKRARAKPAAPTKDDSDIPEKLTPPLL